MNFACLINSFVSVIVLSLGFNFHMLSHNFLIVNLSATSKPPISVDGMEDEAVVSILQDDGTLIKEEGDARTRYHHAKFSKLK